MSTIPALDAIAARRKALREEIARLQAEDGELQIAERVLNRIALPEVVAPAHIEIGGDHGSEKPSTRRIIRDYLARTPNLWRTANEIQENVSEIKGTTVPMSSISPTLTDMKNQGLLVRDGLKVALTVRVKREQPDFFNENGEAKASPETGEPDRSPIENQTTPDKGVFD